MFKTISLFFFLTAALPCWASSLSLTGSLNPNDPNDVLLVAFQLSAATHLTVQSYGYGGTSAAPDGANLAGTVVAPGGFDPYLSLFGGLGSGATFPMSDDDGSCPPATASPACRDSALDIALLPAGTYTLALNVFDNFSYTENYGTGTLGDGFVGLGSYYNLDSDSFRSSQYALDITADGLTVLSVDQTSSAIPEPAGLTLCTAALSLFAVSRALARSRRHATGSFSETSFPFHFKEIH